MTSPAYSKILVRATNWVGDAVMSLPALQALREQMPEAHITILARPWVADIYERERFADDVIPYSSPRGWTDLSGKLRLARELRAHQFDCAVLLQNAFEAAALAWLAGIPNRIGYNRDARGWLLTNAVPPPREGEIPKHQRFYYLELLRRSGLLNDLPASESIRLHGARDAARLGRQRYRSLGIERSVVGVSPGAAYGTAKRWSPERFADAAAQTAATLGAEVALFGSADEKALCGQITAMLDGMGIPAHNFAGDTSLREFIELCAACRVYLTNDSGAMHIASALGVPTVAVFGATDDIATGPTGELAQVIREPVECSPCLLRECPIDHRCMTRVPADRVAHAALELLK
jgi:heptosyltransferase-2